MTIRSSDGPVGGREAVNRALNHLMAGTEVPDTRAPIGGADHKRRTTQPIAVFRVDFLIISTMTASCGMPTGSDGVIWSTRTDLPPWRMCGRGPMASRPSAG